MNKQLFVVAGMHRSGTSTFARMLTVFDIPLGDQLRPAAADNPRGFWEDEAFVAFNDRLLEALSLNWASLDGFFLTNETFSPERFAPLKAEARALLAERFADRSCWGVKDPRISRLLGFWKPIFAQLSLDVGYLVALREPRSVSASLSARNDLGPLYGELLWSLYNADLVSNLVDERARVASYDALLEDPRAELERLAPFFNSGVPSESAIEAFTGGFLDASLRHGPDLSGGTPGLAVADELFTVLETAIRSEDSLTDPLVEVSLKFRDQWLEDGVSRLSRVEGTALHREISGLLTERQTRFDFTVGEFRREQERLHSTVAELERSVEFHKDREAKRLRDARALETALDQTRSEVEALRTKLDETVVRLREVQGSRSWRLTRPLRSTARAARRAKRFVVDELLERSPAWRAAVEWSRWLSDRARGESTPAVLRASHAALISHRRRAAAQARDRSPGVLPDIDVSIVTHNSARWIDPFLESLLGQRYPLDKLFVTVVDHASTDDTVARFEARARALQSALGGFRVIEAPNGGFGAGHNRGVAAGSADFVLVTNVDLEFDPGSLTRLVSAACADDPTVASWECRQQPHEHPKFYDPVSGDTNWSSHACVLFRRACFEEVGGYEERIFMYGEDVELSFRLRSLGYRLRYLPVSTVWHHTYETPGEHKPLQFEGSTLANAYIRIRYGSVADALAVVPMYARLLRFCWRDADQRRRVIGNIGKILRHAPHFMRHRRRTAVFAFRGWDYELVRDGAFYEAPAADSDEVPLVSIVTRTYAGRAPLLREAIRSVLGQTWPAIELVVVEDGGATLKAIVESAVTGDPDRTVHFVEMPKVGRCLAGNAGLAAARGEYLMFLDDDDLLFSDHVETCVRELEVDRSLGGVYALPWELLTDTAVGGYEEHVVGTADGFRQPFDRGVLAHHNFIPIQAALFRRELYERFGGFDPALENLEDWNLWVRYTSEQDFKLIEKTTSMFRTPRADEDRQRRQRNLDSYYETANAKNRAFIEAMNPSSAARDERPER